MWGQSFPYLYDVMGVNLGGKSYENSLLPITGCPWLPLVSGIPHDNNQLGFI